VALACGINSVFQQAAYSTGLPSQKIIFFIFSLGPYLSDPLVENVTHE